MVLRLGVVIITATGLCLLTFLSQTYPGKIRLGNMLEQFRELSYQIIDNALGRTAMATHKITTMGPPIQQPLRQLPESLKAVVQQELKSMHAT